MPNLCKNCNRYPVFGGGMCLYCQYMRTDKKPTKIRPRKKQKEQYGFKSQPEVFENVWNKYEDERGFHYCWLTGVQIDRFWGNSRESWMFAHVLPKGRFPKWKLNPDNIRLLHPDVHTLVDNYTSDMENETHELDGRATKINFKRWFNLQNELRRRYET